MLVTYQTDEYDLSLVPLWSLRTEELKIRKNRTIENKKKYSCYRNILLSCIRSSKNTYFKELFNKKSTRITKMWSVLGSFLNPKRCKNNNGIKSIYYEGSVFEDDAGIAEALNKHFCNIGQKTAGKIKPPNTSFIDYLKNPIENTFFLTRVDEKEIETEIQSLKVRKTPGHDEIKPSIIKLSCSHLAKPLTHLYNVSFSTGQMPDVWKVAKVIPIFKSGDKHISDNYRPISLLSCFEKILERLLAKRVTSFLKKHKILYKLQFGFREGHSTTHALLELLEKIYANLDTNNSCIGIFLDLSKAFDTIDHSILLHKLQHYGFRGKILDWFSSYLTNRMQYTSLNGKNSSLGHICKGVPQGSVLGPILFTLYVNDMPSATSLEPRLFSDDTNLFNFGNNLTAMINNTNIELEKLDSWLRANKLMVNTSKTNYCLFHPSKTKSVDDSYIVKMGDELKQSDDIKYLGIKLDNKLTWENHVHKVKSEIIKYTSMFSKLRHYVQKPCLMSLYDSLVLSKISYAFEAFGIASQNKLKDLQVLQNRILRILQFKDRKYSTNAIHKECNILKLIDLYEFKILKSMHNVHYNNGKLPSVFKGYFEKNEGSHTYPTRQSKDYKIFRVNKTWGDKMIRNKGARLWNELPSPIKDISNPYTFAKKLKEVLIDKY